MRSDLRSVAEKFELGCLISVLFFRNASPFQEKMIDLESDLEELHDSEQRWAAKHKRAIEQVGDPSQTGHSFSMKPIILRML